MRGSQKKKEREYGKGSKVFAWVTFLLFIGGMFWLKDGYFLEGKFLVKDAVATVCVWIFVFLMAYMPTKLPDVKQWIYNLIALILIIFAAFACDVYSMFGFGLFTSTIVSHSLLMYVMVVTLAFLVTNSLSLTAFLVILVGSLPANINGYIVDFRGTVISPSDLFSLGTAAEVAGGYSVIAKYTVVNWILCIILMTQISFFLTRQKQQRNWKKIFAIGGALIIGLFAYFKVLFVPITYYDYNPGWAYSDVGFWPGFVKGIPRLFYKKPVGYNAERAEELLSQEELITADDSKVKAQNIIVIMDESWADLRQIGDGQVSDEYWANYDSLTENTIKGNLYVDTFGGGTCNTEFEALTGVSVRYARGYPFMSLIRDKTSSLATTLRRQGYETKAFHPEKAKNWGRRNVYPLLGFSSFESQETMGDKITNDMLARAYISDSASFKLMEQMIPKDTPNFMFHVTMQNHSPYDEEGMIKALGEEEYAAIKQNVDKFEIQADLSDVGDGNYPLTETYLSLMKATDGALGDLIQYYSNVEEPTLICMFGDHQVGLEETFYDYLYGKVENDRTPDEMQQKYVTPFVIWTNYDSEETYIEKMSVNYLSAFILKQANVDLSPYESFLYHTYEQYPVVSNQGIYDANYDWYPPDTDIDQQGRLLDYQYVQYYRMRDENK